MRFAYLIWLRWQLARMRERHVELYARGMEHWHCGWKLEAREHFERAEHLSEEICRQRRRITRLEMCR